MAKPEVDALCLTQDANYVNEVHNENIHSVFNPRYNLLRKGLVNLEKKDPTFVPTIDSVSPTTFVANVTAGSATNVDTVITLTGVNLGAVADVVVRFAGISSDSSVAAAAALVVTTAALDTQLVVTITNSAVEFFTANGDAALSAGTYFMYVTVSGSLVLTQPIVLT